MEAKGKATEETVEFKNTKFWLEELEAEQDMLSNWERDFVESVGGAFFKYGRLTDAQYAKLEDIYNKYF